MYFHQDDIDSISFSFKQILMQWFYVNWVYFFSSSRYFSFCLYFSVMKKNGLINFKTTSLISKIVASQPGKQTIAIQISFNISRSKGNQTMKFDQLIEYNMSNIFVEKLCKNMVEKLFPDPFLQNNNWVYLWVIV